MPKFIRYAHGPFVVIQQKVGSKQTRAIIRQDDLAALENETKDDEIAMIHFIIDGDEADEQHEILAVPMKLLPLAMTRKNTLGTQFLLFNVKQLRERTLQVKVDG